jgi:uncharacterized membrane protein
MGYIICAIFGMVFLLFAVVFAILKEKAAMLVSGFNTMPKEERKLYDAAKISKDQRNTFLLMAIILGVGAVLAYFLTQYIAILAFIICFVAFFKDVHLDPEKAFEKYKIK